MGFSQVSGDTEIIPRALLQSQLVQIKCTFWLKKKNKNKLLFLFLISFFIY